jgi:hypothetical protein
MNPRCRLSSQILGFALAAFSPREAAAGNEDELFVGNHAAMTGGAVTAMVSDGSSIWYNPAGLAAADRDSIDVSGAVYSLRFYGVDGFIRSELGGREDARVREFIAAPTQVAYVRQLTEGLTLGLGYFMPRAANLVLREHLSEQFDERSSNFTVEAISIYSQFVVGAVLGFHLAPGVRMGAGILGNYETVTESSSISGSLSQSGQVIAIAQTESLTTQALIGLEPTVGIQIDLTRKLVLAASARAPRFSVYNVGSTQSSTSFGLADGSPEDGLGALIQDTRIRGAPFEVVRSGRYHAAAAYRTGAGWISGGADIQPGLIDPAVSVFRETTWNARLGTYQPVSDRLALGVGVFTDRAPATVSDVPLVFSGANFYGGSLGAEFTNRRILDASERVDTLRFTTVAAFRYAYASDKTYTLGVDPHAAPADFFREVHSDIGIHELTLYIGSGLYF